MDMTEKTDGGKIYPAGQPDSAGGASIEQQIRQFVSANLLFDSSASYADEASFLREGIVDSMGVMELVSFVQTTFGIEITPQEVTPDNFDSVSKLARFIRSKAAGRTPTPQ